jgi:hypothetical protein
MIRKIGSDLEERVKILEKALQDMADTLRKRETEFDEDFREVFEELKALKLFLSRNMPEFRKQFPDIHRKIKAA